MKKLFSAIFAMGLAGVFLCLLIIPHAIVRGQNPISVNQGVPGSVFQVGCFGVVGNTLNNSSLYYINPSR